MHHNTHSSLPHAALEAADRGWPVFPLVPDAKRPAIKSWESRATIDPVRIRRCWAAGSYNVGVAAGPGGIVIVDLDVPKHDQDVPPAGTPSGVVDGADVLAALAQDHGQPYPTDTYTVRTASGGTHLYFTAPAGVDLRNTAGALGWKIDTRGWGGYVVGVGSTIRGTSYSLVHDAPPLPLPQWLATLLAPKPLPPQEPVAVPLLSKDRHSSYLRAAVTGELERVSRARTGGRNEALYQASVALGQLVAGQELGEDEVTGWLTAAALGTGLAEPDVRRTVASGLRAGAKRPRTIRGRAA
ncbi:bifunctional DNA primase/polymerase [Streptomyces microflavus]|uniref:bifunctional DNA primase/polymerase n=1 Tax=Streptomyces microflavus TaxID=1919 RepID=UPI00365FFBA3